MTMTATPPETDVSHLTFDTGLPGFPEARRFVLVNWGDEGSPFSIMRCLDDAALEFVVVPPVVFFPEYEPEIDDATAEQLKLESGDDALILVIVTLGATATDATANLLGPIVINRHTNVAAQAILVGDYELREPLVRG